MLIEAINNSFHYTPKQREILILFLNIEINNIAFVTALELTKVLNTSKVTVYTALEKLEQDGFIKRAFPKGKHASAFELNKDSFDKLLQIYSKKKIYLEKK